MKVLNLKDEEVLGLLGEMECNGYDEEVVNGEIASATKRSTYYTCERTYHYNGKTYKATWECHSIFDCSCAYNDLEDVKELYEV